MSRASFASLTRSRLPTWEKLARAAGMIRANPSRIEASKHRPTLETMERMPKALKVPVADLIAAR